MNTTKKCLFCKEEILQDATICKHCSKKQPASFKTISKVILGIFIIGIIGAAFPPCTQASPDALSSCSERLT
jgi:preprotein translocase subunit Sss1